MGAVEDQAEQERYLHTAQRYPCAVLASSTDLFELAQLDAGGSKLERWPNPLAI